MRLAKRFGSALLCLAALSAGGGMAQVTLAQPVTMSAEDLRAVYAELLQTHDGFVYTVNLVGYPDEASARNTWAQLQQPRFRMQRMDRLMKNVAPRNVTLYTVDPPLRELLANLSEGDRAGPVLTSRGWAIVEMISMRAAPAPTFEAAAAGIPALVAARILPSAEQLRDDPALRLRAVANRIATVEDLDAAPPGLDVNGRLSAATTLLLRTILRDKPDLVAALIRRGANPNLCAHRFCPMHLAIYRKQPATVDALLKAGADPNQRDPAAGTPEGPLSAAAFQGDLALAERLLAAGAKVEGVGKVESPLMAAASAANRPMVELLLAKGADPFAVTDTAPARGALDSAMRSKNAEFAAWLRGVMRERAKASGRFAWDGWIEQEGRRFPLDGKPVALRKAPFAIVLRTRPGEVAYATASGSPRLFEEAGRADPEGNAFLSGMNISAEDDENDKLVVHEPQKPGARWGGSQAWWKDEGGKDGGASRYSSVRETPQGREHVRQVRQLIVIGADDKIADPAPVAAYAGDRLHLVLGTRVRMTLVDDEVFAPRNVEIRFAR